MIGKIQFLIVLAISTFSGPNHTKRGSEHGQEKKWQAFCLREVNVENVAIIEKYLDELKRMLMFEDEFSDTFDFFMDRLGQDASFMTSGKPYKNPDFRKVLHAVGTKVVKEEIALTKVSLKLFKAQKFICGLCQVNGHLMTVFFFKEVHMGMAVLANPDKGLFFARFTIFEAPNKRMTLQNLSGPTLH